MRRLWAPRLSGFRMRDRIRRGGRASRRAAGEFADVDGGFAVDVLEGGALAVVIVAALVLMTIEAVSEGGDRHRWRVVGLRASREHAADVANALAHGNPLPSGEEPSRPAVDGATSASP